MRLSVSSGKDLALRRTGAEQEATSNGEQRLNALATRAAQGDRSAFAQVYDALATDVYAFVAYRTGGEAGLAETDDIVAEVFLKAWRYARSFDAAKGPYRAWIFTIARNELLDAMRRAREAAPDLHLGEIEAEHAVPADEDDATAESVVGAVALRTALERLPVEERDAVVLHYFGNCSFREIGKSLGMREGAARRLVLRGVTHLRRGLDDAT